MKVRVLLIALLFAGGCATQRPLKTPAEAPPPLGEEKIQETIIIEEELPVPEVIPAPKKEILSWDEIKELGTTYVVKKGDTLSGIAARHKVGTGLLARLNDLKNPDLIRVGQRLSVIEGPFRIEVRKEEKLLSVYLNDRFIRSYAITTGRDNSTPEGEFSVIRKLVKPPWTDPYHRTIVRADNPEYPLGTRWIEFVPPPGAYGIHGSKEVQEIGKEASFGCIRVLHPQEEEIYNFVILGSSILIKP